jgi:hypothetical protein
LVLDATVNPDFGQVEVDPAVVNLSDFETYFPERRPFFIEGSQTISNFGRNGANSFWGFSRSEPNLFYSRRIGRRTQGGTDAEFESRPAATTILGAAKITGKTPSGWSLAVLDAVTGREWADLAEGAERSRQEIEPLTNYFVARAHRELSRSGVGFIATAVNRDLRAPQLGQELVRQAYVVGLDGYHFLDESKDWVVNGRLATSRVSGSAGAIEALQSDPRRYFQRPDADHVRLGAEATSLSGWTGSVNLNRNGGNFRINSAVWANSPGFESNDLGFNWRSDRWGSHLAFSWRKPTPDRITRQRSVSVAKWYAWNFAHERQSDGIFVAGWAQLLNYWTVDARAFKTMRVLDDRLTRGGPSVLKPAGTDLGVCLESDSRKRLTAHLGASYSSDEFGSWQWSGHSTLEIKPSSSLSFEVGPQLTRGWTAAQWVDSFEDPLATATFGERYVFAGLDRTELAMSIRASLILSPNLSFQLFAQPLISVGDYAGFKQLDAPRSFDFSTYGDAVGTIAHDAEAQSYTVDPDGSGPGEAFTFDDPDFNLKSLRLSAVFRWEYRPGATLYAVWTQQREDSLTRGDFDLGRDARGLFSASTDDIFLVKLSYRFSH